jgi:hypothetical protein
MTKTALIGLLVILVAAGCVAPPRVPPTVAPPATEVSRAPAPTVADVTPQPSNTAPATTAPAVTAAATASASSTAPPTAMTVPTAAPTLARITVQPTKAPTKAPTNAAAAAATALPPPTVSGSDVVTRAVRGATTYRVEQLSLPTYPYEALLGRTADDERAGYPVLTLDRAAYEATGPQPAPKAYRLLVLENEYLRLGILPDLGGRIYELTFKPTGSNELYANTVVKPTQWGPPSPPYPPGANWWLAAGGMEWGFPVEEHGYEFGTVWGYDHAAQPDGGVMLTLFTKTGPQAPYAVVDVILPPDAGYFVVQPRIVNPLGASFRFKWWANTMLAPGPANSASPELRFILPGSSVTVHSTGDPTLPQAGQTMSWPLAGGRDLSRLANWQHYLGAFSQPVAGGAFAGVYDEGVNEGMLRVVPSGTAKGLKLFAPRGTDGLDPALWTDDGSSYVELHGGLTANFGEWYELAPGAEVTWSEYWYPVAGIGGVTFANTAAALSFVPSAGGLRLGIFPTEATEGQVTVALPGVETLTLDLQAGPAAPFVRELGLPEAVTGSGEVTVRLIDRMRGTILEWTGAVQLR